MTETSQFLVNHGLPLVFGAVFLEQMGLPLPAPPWLLAAGALASTGKFNLIPGIAVAVAACLSADAIWFYLGRFRGTQVLGVLCRISLEPDSCVRRTQNLFTRYGLRGVVVAKFVPGMSTIAPPLAGMSGIGAGRFLLVDGLGSLLYISCFVLLGFLFSAQIQRIVSVLSSVGGSALGLMAGLIVLYVAYKYWQRQRLLHALRVARITADELHQMLETGESPVILDLRSHAELELDPTIIRGATHLVLEDIEKRQHEFPRDRDIIVYCSCPNEVTSARVALQLHRKGFTRVRPLLGGIDTWRNLNYPMETRNASAATVTVIANATSAAVDSAPGLILAVSKNGKGKSV
jgi:membrane protein DedA with SNARE-associated domain/rhodanese-related sulfurtransferase